MDNNEFYQIIEQADVLFREGEALFQQNNFNDYYEVFDTASKLYLKVESWEKYLWCRYRMTIWLSARNHIKEAKAIGEEELKLCYQKIKGIHELKAEFHYRLFFCNFYQSNYDEATKEAQEALSMAQALKNRAIIVKSYNALASICTHTNKYIIGLTFLFKALPHTKLIERKVETIYVYQTMGHIYFHLRQFYLSKIYLRRTITLCEKQYGNEHPHIINPIMIIGTIKGQEGHYEEAIIDFEKAINLKQKIGIEDRELTSTFFDLARMKAKLGNWNEANEYFEKAIQLQKKVDENNYRWLSNSYFRWAGLLKQNNRLKEAKIFAKKSREVLPKSAVFQLAYAYILETKISRIERDWATALRQLKKANEYLSEIVLNQKEEVYSLNLELYELQLNVYLHYCKENRSRAYLDAALLLFVNIQQLIGNARTVVFETKDQLKLGQEITKIYQIATDILYELYLLEPGGAFLEQIFSFSEKNKVHSLLLTIQDLEALQLSTIPNKQLKELRTLQSQINEYQTTLQRSEDGFQEERFDQYAEELVSLQVRYHQMIKEIEQNHPEYLQLKHQTTEISLQEIQNQLPIGEGAISYTLTENSLYILCILSKQVFLQQMEISVGFYDLINTFIDEGILGMNRKTYVHEAYQLYQILIAPIEDKLVENKVESLLILPDSQLLELPFEALLTQEASFRTAYSDMPYLLKDYSIRYHYSATLRQYQQNRKANLQDLPSRFLGFAPVYDEGYSSLEVSEELEEEATRDVSIRGKNYKALLYSEKEVNDIQSNFQKKGLEAKTYLRGAANLSDFKKQVEAQPAKYLHIAAHGVSNQKKNVLGVLFSPENETGNTYERREVFDKAMFRTQEQTTTSPQNTILYAHELYQLKLRCDLVFLSCCESGVGKISEGEGILSLNRGLLYSGVSNIVFTLFKIYDQKTAQFAHHFYDYLLNQKENYAQALRYAKLQLIIEDLPPKYWSGFLLLGE